MKEKDISSIEKARWFYFSGRHHYGPFSFQQMVGFFRSGEISRRTFIWRKGEADWMPLEEVSDFWGVVISPPTPPQSPDQERTQEEGPPPLPPEEEIEEKPRVQLNFYAPPARVSKPPKKALSEMEPPPIPENSPPEERPQEKGEKTTERVLGESFERQKSPWVAGISAVFILLFLSSLLALYERSRDMTEEDRVILRGLSSSDYQRLENLRTEKEKTSLDALKMELASGYDGQRLWGTMNDSRSRLLFIKLFSKESLVLSPSPVLLQSHSPLVEKVVNFETWRVLEGRRLSPGLYDFEILAYPKEAFEKFSSSQRDLLRHSSVNPAFKVEGQMVLGGLSKKELATKLKDWRSQRGEDFKNRLDFLEQSFITLSSLIEKQKTLVAETFPLLKKGTDAKKFEKKYSREIAPVLQGIIVEVIRGKKEDYPFLQSRTPELVKDLERLGEQLAEAGKTLAGRFSFWSSKLGRQGEITSDERKSFRESYRNELNDLEEEMELLKPLKKRVVTQWSQFLQVDKDKLQNSWQLKTF